MRIRTLPQLDKVADAVNNSTKKTFRLANKYENITGYYYRLRGHAEIKAIDNYIKRSAKDFVGMPLQAFVGFLRESDKLKSYKWRKLGYRNFEHMVLTHLQGKVKDGVII